MEPAAQTAYFAEFETQALYTVEAETHVSKEFVYHVLRGPTGLPDGYYKTLGQLFDRLTDLGQRYALLTEGDWTVLIDLDQEGQRIPLPDKETHG